MPQLFVVIAPSTVSIGDTVKLHYPNNSMNLHDDPGKWLVVADGTSRDVSNTLGITAAEGGAPSKIPSAIVFTVAGYYGRAQQPVWEWVFTQLGGHLSAK